MTDKETSDACEVMQGSLRLMIKELLLNGLLSYQMVVLRGKCMQKVQIVYVIVSLLLLLLL
jgi:hypothetical protein